MERKINVIQQDGETYYKVADISKMLPSGNDYLPKKLEIETVYLNEDNHVRPYKYIDDAGIQMLLGYLRSEKGEYMRADMIESAAERGLADLSVEPISKDEEYGELVHPKFGTIRTLTIDGMTLYCGIDVATVLKFPKPNMAADRGWSDNAQQRCVPRKNGKLQFVTFIDENGVYKLIHDSGHPDAENFQYWLFTVMNPKIASEVVGDDDVSCDTLEDNNNMSVTTFNSDEFGHVRAIMVDNEPWFVGKDVAIALGYSNASKAVMVHVDDEDKHFEMLSIADSQNGNLSGATKTALINESGVYSLIFGSKLESAKRFKRWVTSEVLPTIRKTGGYIADSDKMVDTYCSGYDETTKRIVSSLLGSMKASQDKINGLQREVDLLSHQARTYNPKAVVAALVRSFAAHCLDNDFQKGFRLFYKDLYYKKQIMLNRRLGGKSQLDRVLDDEWYDVVEVAVALCVTHGVDVERAINSVNNELIGA